MKEFWVLFSVVVFIMIRNTRRNGLKRVIVTRWLRNREIKLIFGIMSGFRQVIAVIRYTDF